MRQNNKGKGRLKYLLQQTELFAHFAKGDLSESQKKEKGKWVILLFYCSFAVTAWLSIQVSVLILSAYRMAAFVINWFIKVKARDKLMDPPSLSIWITCVIIKQASLNFPAIYWLTCKLWIKASFSNLSHLSYLEKKRFAYLTECFLLSFASYSVNNWLMIVLI